MNEEQIKAMELALEALEKSDEFLYNWHENASDDEADVYSTVRQLNEQAITAIKEALEQPEQEPVAWERPIVYTPPHMAPPQRTWVGLTEEEKRQLFLREDYSGWLDYIDAIEAKLKEKNT